MADEAMQTFAILNAAGEVIFEFEGIISATGLLIPASTAALPEGKNQIIWYNPAEKTDTIASLYAKVSGGQNLFLVSSDTPEGNPAYLQIRSGAANPLEEFRDARISAGRAIFVVEALNFSEGAQALARCGNKAGVFTERLVWSGLENSDFVQLAVRGNRAINGGLAVLEFAASKIPAGPITVSHGLGRVPVAVTANSENNVVTLSTSSYTSTTFQLWGGNWFEAITGKLNVHWQAFG